MKNFKLILLTGLLSLSLSSPAYASKNQSLIKSQKKFSYKIKKGIASGKLTRTEAKNLRQDKRLVDRMRKKAKRNDGVIDRQEFKHIRMAQAEFTRKLNIKKNNLRVRRR